MSESYEYRVVPFIGKIKGSKSADEVASQLQQSISSNATGGWEFWQLGDVNIEVSPGCLAGLFGAKVTYMTYNQLIFRRKIG